VKFASLQGSHVRVVCCQQTSAEYRSPRAQYTCRNTIADLEHNTGLPGAKYAFERLMQVPFCCCTSNPFWAARTLLRVFHKTLY
jgi:hypothetical protein